MLIVLQRLLDFLEDNSTVYLDEIQQFIYNEYELETSIATISCVLKYTKWSRKAVQVYTTERNKLLQCI
jgi:hypothetical protein